MNRYAAVILAAGDSHRMGTPKALLAFRNDMNFLEACLKAFNDIGCEEVVVVVNQYLYRLLASKGVNLHMNARLVLNAYPARGRFFSLQCGLRAISVDTNTFFHNVDNPFITPGVLKALINSEKEADVICPAYRGKRGHPVLINNKVVSDLISESNYDRHLRDYLDRYRHVSVPVTDPNILININTPDEYARMLGGNDR